eukprot:CAMPEP_0171021626 /NCGR_PEP_ID=MMETSP0736-20130129/30788_1 /TAXON_ID=186038 /ORGANISM="Fragilariopsis kerguelensis, Strain L26-C5" /LENGTH=412 /DNA_ID=CAMNT_0011459985 /DNA_START=112 /DNA_END=1350 /DNA_ORIENTATION=-
MLVNATAANPAAGASIRKPFIVVVVLQCFAVAAMLAYYNGVHVHNFNFQPNTQLSTTNTNTAVPVRQQHPHSHQLQIDEPHNNDNSNRNSNNNNNSIRHSNNEDGARATMTEESKTETNKEQEQLLTMIQIGANDGVTENNQVVATLLQHPAARAVLVEGSPSVFRLLVSNIREKFDATLTRLVPLNALVCEDRYDKEGHLQPRIFYSVDADKIRSAAHRNNITDLSLPHWVEYQIGSLERSSTVQGLRAYVHHHPHVFRGSGYRMFVKEEVLPCVSFPQILAAATHAGGGGGGNNLQPEEVQVLAVDVEGYDAHIVLESFQVPGLEPELIVFEYKIAIDLFPVEFRAVMETLHQKGYETNCAPIVSSATSADAQGDNHNHNNTRSTSASGWECSGNQDVWARKQSPPPSSL